MSLGVRSPHGLRRMRAHDSGANTADCVPISRNSSASSRPSSRNSDVHVVTQDAPLHGGTRAVSLPGANTVAQRR